MGQLFDRISRLARVYWTDATSSDVEWAERLIDSQDDELRRAIDEAALSVNDDVVHAHNILRIPLGSTAAAVKEAYRSAMRQWHPDRFVNGTLTEQNMSRQKAQEINTAYLILKTYYGF
ncbi:MAG: J domain-containing protein [Ignavibacteria bacterium]|nr:J domain-containing protein [Ignavibacteria bacterium]